MPRSLICYPTPCWNPSFLRGPALRAPGVQKAAEPQAAEHLLLPFRSVSTFALVSRGEQGCCPHFGHDSLDAGGCV